MAGLPQKRSPYGAASRYSRGGVLPTAVIRGRSACAHVPQKLSPFDFKSLKTKGRRKIEDSPKTITLSRKVV